MTETLSKGAANQAGARVDADAYAKAADFLPLNGIDHVEFWVGNARQAVGLLPRALGVHARSPSAASRPRSATARATSWSRTTSGSSSRRR